MSLIQTALANIEITIGIFIVATVFSIYIPSRINLFINGTLLFAICALFFVQDTALIYSQIAASPLKDIVVAFVLGSTSFSILQDSIKESTTFMKEFSFISGLALVSLLTIPELYAQGAINFNIPEFEEQAKAILYGIAGFVAFLTAIFEEEKK
jgi:hypothetical protein